jgi:RND superfamily putative drug exporter
LRAIVAAGYLLLTNVLSYLAALGTTILITEKLFGWEHISYRIPLYLFIFLVALGSDYNIFITTRIRSEAFAKGLKEGVVKALSATGGVLTSAGIILAGTFLILLSQPVKDLVEISIGVRSACSSTRSGARRWCLDSRFCGAGRRLAGQALDGAEKLRRENRGNRAGETGRGGRARGGAGAAARGPESAT